nr:immunoglobulin heavy chain junction region [Mus musculus]
CARTYYGNLDYW